MSQLLQQVLKKEEVKSKTITGTSTPGELLEWMNKNLAYVGENKGKLLLPQEVVEKKKAHCWEAADLAYHELSTMGCECSLLYMEDEGCKSTHTTVIYQADGKYYWYEWAWLKNAGIHGPFKTIDEVIEIITKSFKESYHSVQEVALGHGRIRANMTERAYVLMTDSWKKVKF